MCQKNQQFRLTGKEGKFSFQNFLTFVTYSELFSISKPLDKFLLSTRGEQ